MGSGISTPKLFAPPGGYNATQDGGALATPNNTASGTQAGALAPYTPPAPVTTPTTPTTPLTPKIVPNIPINIPHFFG